MRLAAVSVAMVLLALAAHPQSASALQEPNEEAYFDLEPASGAQVRANTVVMFSVITIDDLGTWRLDIAEDAEMELLAYSAETAEAPDFFITPAEEGIFPGTYWWRICWDTLSGEQCTAPRQLVVLQPRRPSLSLSTATAAVAEAFPSWDGGYGHRYRCRRALRTTMRCRPSMIVGDVYMYGRLRLRANLNGSVAVTGTVTYRNDYCRSTRPRRHWRSCYRRQRIRHTYVPQQGAPSAPTIG